MEETLQNTKLGLKLPTDPRWVDLASFDLGEILTDHAYCEQKAATSIISLIQSYPEREHLVEELAPIVTEEWGHFRMVLQELKKRNLKLGSQRKDEYVNELLKFQQKGLPKEEALLETAEPPLSHTGLSLKTLNAFGFDLIDGLMKESWLIRDLLSFAHF